MASVLVLFESRRVSSVMVLGFATVLLVGLAITESRSGALGLLIMVAWWFFKSRRIGFLVPPWAIGLGSASFLFCLWQWPSFFYFTQEGGWTETTLAAQINNNAGSRLVIWPQLYGIHYSDPGLDGVWVKCLRPTIQ